MNRFPSGLVLVVLYLLIGPGTLIAAPHSPTNHFQFKFPAARALSLDETERKAAQPGASAWIKAWPEKDRSYFVELGDRVVVEVRQGADLQAIGAAKGLQLSRAIAPTLAIFQAKDAVEAAAAASELSTQAEVVSSYPVMRQTYSLHGPYAPEPKDYFYWAEWNLEHRNPDGTHGGPDLNVRAAWPFTHGEGVTIAAADTGVELTHVELTNRISGAPHFNFATPGANAGPIGNGSASAHGTEVAGLAVAELAHARMVGVAPGSRLASWVIFRPNLLRNTDEQMMDAYQYRSNTVAVQNHSWGTAGLQQTHFSTIEDIGISNAITYGRSGKGVVMVRSAGNDRLAGANANDDGYPSDPRVICAAAVRIDGRVSSYSEPGACVLVGAPSGDTGLDGLLTTDLIGPRGANALFFFPPFQDMSDYVFNQLGFSGTSAAAPQISAVVALMLSANPDLSYRDVQQILILASRHFDLADPDLRTNGAGLLVSHNDGYGIPDAGVAVDFARRWLNRPAATNILFTSTTVKGIPDDGLKVEVSGHVPKELKTIGCLPGTGPHPDEPTPVLELVDCGDATNAIALNLTNKAALIQRGGNTFSDKINFAAQAGAAFAVIYNFATNSDPFGAPGGDQLIPLGGTDYTPIPAVFIGHTDGAALKEFIAQTNVRARLRLQNIHYSFDVPQTLQCEHVSVRVKSDHPLRGDVRVTLVSPSGTRSVLQRYNADEDPGPVDWTYYSVQHFFEGSAGTWTVYVSDEGAGASGSVHEVTLGISGVPISDRDHDGLADTWERAQFKTLAQTAASDPDRDGYSNLLESLLGSDPNRAEPLQLDLSKWNSTMARVSWPGSTNYTYEVWGGTNVTSTTRLGSVPGVFPVTEWFAPSGKPRQFFRVIGVPAP